MIVQGNCPGRGIVKERWYGVRARVVTLTLTLTLGTCDPLNTVTFNVAGIPFRESYFETESPAVKYFEIK